MNTQQRSLTLIHTSVWHIDKMLHILTDQFDPNGEAKMMPVPRLELENYGFKSGPFLSSFESITAVMYNSSISTAMIP